MDTTQPLPTNLSDQLPNITGSLTDAMAPFILLSAIVTILFVAAYIVSLIRRWKVEKAILSMQKDIHEMNERDKQREVARTPREPITPDQTIIAEQSSEQKHIS